MNLFWRTIKNTRVLALFVFLCVILASLAIFLDNSPISTRAKAADGEDITISANTTWSAGTYVYRDITITNNATLTLNGTYSTDTNGTGVIINARTVTVTTGATISANGKGYAAYVGTGKGAPSGNFGSGAGYGGAGGVGDTGTAGGTTYGSAIKPLDLGSGGGNSGGGGAGGGAINLNLTGNLVLAGTISANGNNVGGWSGSGSGGSIYIVATDMSGTGTITANGGSVSGGADGGGGRVALYYNGTYSLDPTKVLASNGGSATDGSVFILDRVSKDLTVSKNIILTALEGIDTNGDPSTDGVFNLRNLTVTNNSVLTVSSKYTTDYDGSGIDFRLTGILTVNTGSTIDAKGRGYLKNNGEGKGTASGNFYGGGGAHGGNGGKGEDSSGGVKYDSTLFPAKLGSGGVTTKGAAGGGIIKVSANQMVVDGSLDASASDPTGDGATNGSGGSGGTIYLVSTTVSGSGTMLANGSNGYGWSGGGGGGRIAIYSDTSSFTANNITATKGLRGGNGTSADGGAGTVFLYNTVTGNVTASSDVTFEATQGVSRDGSIRTDGVFYFNNLTVTNDATVTVGGTFTDDTDGRGVTINLDGILTVDAGSKITASGQGYTGMNGPGKGTGTTSTSGSGGSYGGVGGKSYDNNLAPVVYGATQANYPYLLGSGGGNGYNGYGVGGKGGGAVTLRVLGSVLNNGEISASGLSGTGSYSSWVPGGGSGGSIFINCNSLSGAGTIWAQGGAGAGDASFGSGGGGGGRISIVYTTTQTFPLANFSALGGVGSSSPTRDGTEGSVNIAQRTLPAADFSLQNPNNNSTEFTNTPNVEIVPADAGVIQYKEAASTSELVPTFYSSGWANVADGEDVGTTEGEKTVRAWLKDGNELISSSVGSAMITLDTTEPTAEITNNNQTTGEPTATINLSLDDNLSGIDYITVNGQQVAFANLNRVASKTKPSKIKAYAESTTFETTVNLNVGDNEFPVVVYDKAGNSTTTTFLATRTQVITATPTPTPSPVADTTQAPPTSSSSTASTSTNSEATNLARKIATNQSISPTAGSTDSLTSTADDNELDSDNSSEGQAGEDQPNSKTWIIIVIIILVIVVVILLLRRRATRGARSR